ncbi:uncharacterized protein [Anabrus simplex]|uniref:uncharacterized protein n=1 Tax=Anabrus simplex TaxID=316456 RepID=UPI0035A2831A
MEETLIELVRVHANLYDTGSINYRNQQMRHEAWEEIGKELKMTAQNAKETWDKLRRCYLNALSRRRTKRSVDDAKKITPWKFELQMAFLLPFMEKRDSQSYAAISEDAVTTDNLTEDVTTDDETAEHSTGETGTAEEPSCSQESKHDVIGNFGNVQSANRRKRPRNEAMAAEIIKIMNEIKDMKKEKIARRQEREHMDDTDKFFLHMAGITKTLPPIQQTKIKLLISNAVLQAQIKCQESSSTSDPQFFSCVTCTL